MLAVKDSWDNLSVAVGSWNESGTQQLFLYYERTAGRPADERPPLYILMPGWKKCNTSSTKCGHWRDYLLGWWWCCRWSRAACTTSQSVEQRHPPRYIPLLVCYFRRVLIIHSVCYISHVTYHNSTQRHQLRCNQPLYHYIHLYWATRHLVSFFFSIWRAAMYGLQRRKCKSVHRLFMELKSSEWITVVCLQPQSRELDRQVRGFDVSSDTRPLRSQKPFIEIRQEPSTLNNTDGCLYTTGL